MFVYLARSLASAGLAATILSNQLHHQLGIWLVT